MGDSKKKFAIAGLASILLVAMVVAVAVGVTRKNSADGASVGTSSKAVQAICSPTDYKDACEKSLANANSTDPKTLIETAFNSTIDDIVSAVKSSALLKEAAKDDSTKAAFDVCDEVLGTAVDDLKRSISRVSELDGSKVNEYVEDLKTWLSAVTTYQETCIDAFENTTGDSGEKMKDLLKTARQLSSNALAMVNDITSLISSLNLNSLNGGGAASRKMLWHNDPTDYEPGTEPGTWPSRHLLSVRPNAVVAKDGSGQFKTISAAVAMVPKKNAVPFLIYVKAGVYKEHVEIPKGAHKIVMYGDGPLRTIISGSKNYAQGTKTFQSATLAVNADDFLARDLAVENTAGPEGHQAVALRVSGDRAVFFNCHLNGFQDTLYAHTYRQFYRNCVISGTIDFVFGDALSIFQNCRFVVRRPMDSQACMVTAQGRVDPRSQGAIVIQGGDIVADPALFKAPKPIQVYLGRPWKELSRTIIMQVNIGGFIAPEGWSPWMGNFALDTLYYAEYQNSGPGSNQAHRVHWKGIKHINPKTAQSFTPGRAFGGDYWIAGARIPYVPSML
ncbi:Probable pectinesterase/pectinesterase inhibitor 58 [Striga hermonthica]|uniref:Pectinesterase n=1 Tax=Striga hermonthica TaxID=68872 RepID=A0A9N7MX41_STRHE|nr:Probable pectinesterase/pectinesterase inhibitor 58 [Striga hermonthica]